MKLFLDPHKLKDFCNSNLGVVVTLPPSSHDEGDDGEEVVVGVCAAVEKAKPLPRLKACGLVSPDWRASRDFVSGHYPAGTGVAGIWLRGEKEEEDKDGVESLIKLLIETTDLKDVLGDKYAILISIRGGSREDVAVHPYLFNASSFPVQLSNVDSMCTDPHEISRFLTQHTAMLRVSASFPLYITASAKNVENPISALVERVRSPSCQFLLSSEGVLMGQSPKATLKTLLLEKFKAAAKRPPGSSERRMAHTLDKPVLLELLERKVAPPQLPAPPTLRLGKPLSEACVRVTLPVDVLGLIRWDSTVPEMAAMLKDRICAQLELSKEEMSQKVVRE